MELACLIEPSFPPNRCHLQVFTKVTSPAVALDNVQMAAGFVNLHCVNCPPLVASTPRWVARGYSAKQALSRWLLWSLCNQETCPETFLVITVG